MSEKQPDILTHHAMLVAWGQFAQSIGMIRAIEAVTLHQKTVEHSPQTKVLEFFVAILAGLPHLQELSRSAHPIDQDQAVAKAWLQAGWADYSGVSLSATVISPLLTTISNHGIPPLYDPFMMPLNPLADSRCLFVLIVAHPPGNTALIFHTHQQGAAPPVGQGRQGFKRRIIPQGLEFHLVTFSQLKQPVYIGRHRCLLVYWSKTISILH